MVVQFCKDCGHLLDTSPEDTVQCELCGKTAKNEGLSYTQIPTSENFPYRLRNKIKSHTQEVTHSAADGPRIEIDCPKCPSREASYPQVQMRSADERSTIFYTCLRCKHRYVTI